MALARCSRAALRTSKRLSAFRCAAAPLADLQGSHGTSASCSGRPASWSGTSRCFASSSIEDETHDDFRPQVKSSPANSAADQIKQDITSSKVFIYMKGDPSAPQCGFSNMACRILDAYGVEYDSRNVLVDPDVREAVKLHTEWPTIPQVFVDGEFVGGSDILMTMHQNGELHSMLEASGAKPVQPRTG
ncbi:hypothetical protein WJX74_009351 [Apatococcus lobatus]|uniref:Glutaredoxin domain-containing protein n=1 Tax=Apatococcus lobatus TaxID=904363 RepID=A0AAW1Q8T7_9CHLO